MEPKVSIIIPVYNVEALLPRCLDSIVAQTLREIEIICVNDGSPDHSLEILNQYAAQDSRIRVISQENRGLGGARNRGFDAAIGTYLLYVDSDDWIDPDFCERLFEAAERNNAEIACASMLKIRPSRRRWVVHYTEEQVFDTIHQKFEACHCPPDFHVMNKLLRREMLLRLQVRFREHIVYEDVDYTMRLLCESTRLVTVPQTVYRFMVNPTSITKSRQTPKKQKDKYIAHKAFIAYADTHGIGISPTFRNVTKRHYDWCGITWLKIKDNGLKLTYRVFDLIPVWFKTID